jgi:hypothetical protein
MTPLEENVTRALYGQARIETGERDRRRHARAYQASRGEVQAAIQGSTEPSLKGEQQAAPPMHVAFPVRRVFTFQFHLIPRGLKSQQG